MGRFIKLAAVLTAAACVSAPFSAYAENEENGMVEIGFRIGDDTILINGESVEVEPPYVAGDGVTLVPVRVITEAFGAEVRWNDTENSVTVVYADVELKMWIGSTVAEENGRAVTLEYPPEITDGYHTMAPLRFISESFGATVQYDEATGYIYVTNIDNGEFDGSILETHDEPYVGDSYYGWRMENPSGMYMGYRSENGSYTSFYYNDNSISIKVEDRPVHFDIDRAFVANKASVTGYSMALVSADKKDGKLSYHARGKKTHAYTDIYVTDRYLITVSCNIYDDEQASGEMLRLMNSFTASYNGDGTYDIAELTDGKRKCELEDINFTVLIPPSWSALSGDEAVNSFSFGELDSEYDIGSTMMVEVFSKRDRNVQSASWLAAHDLTINRSIANPELCAFSSLTPRTYTGFSAFEYTDAMSGGDEGDCLMRDVFFDMGDYVYNVSLYMRSGESDADIDEILNSIEVSAPDASKLGTLLRTSYDLNSNTYVSETNELRITLPYSFEKASYSFSEYADYLDALTKANLSYLGRSNYEDLDDFKDHISSMPRRSEIIKPAAEEIIGDKACFTVTYRLDGSYWEYYSIGIKDGYIDFIVEYPEMYYSDVCRERVRGIIASIEYIK